MTTSQMSAMVLRRSPLRHPLLPIGRGQRSPQTSLAVSERDALLREVARRYCTGMSDRAAAAMLHTALMRYQTGRWRRSRVDLTCPHDGERLEAMCWRVLKVRDHCPSERLIRQVLSRSSSSGLFPAQQS